MVELVVFFSSGSQCLYLKPLARFIVYINHSVLVDLSVSMMLH